MPSLIQPENARRLLLGVAHTFKVDPATGRLTDLALITANREAKGHGLWIDQKSIETTFAAIASRGGKLKAYITHDHSGPCTWGDSGSELDIPGFFSGLAIRGDQLVAGSFEFYDAFKKNCKAQFEQLVEMAQKTPDLFALSIEPWGYAVYVDAAGNEYGSRPDNVDLLYDGLPALRVTDCFAAAFVAEGAANDSLFAKLSAKLGPAFAQLFGGKHSETNPPIPSTVPPPATNVNQPTPMPLTIAQIKAKFTVTTLLASAIALATETPDITMEVLEAKVAAADQAAKDTKITTLAAELATAKKDHETALAAQATASATALAAVNAELATAKALTATLTAERDAWKAQFETIKGSGTTEQNLGITPAVSSEPNPWMPESKNLTRQCEIQKTNPALAASFKAAAKIAKDAAKK
jgi:hypothetical protein